jgi:hypothetical protein
MRRGPFSELSTAQRWLGVLIIACYLLTRSLVAAIINCHHLLSGLPSIPTVGQVAAKNSVRDQACALRESITKQLEALPLPTRKQPNQSFFSTLGISRTPHEAAAMAQAGSYNNPLKKFKYVVLFYSFLRLSPKVEMLIRPCTGWSSWENKAVCVYYLAPPIW